jgi:hypothetical protein
MVIATGSRTGRTTAQTILEHRACISCGSAKRACGGSRPTSSISIRCTDRTGETPTQETLWALDESGPRRQGSLSRRRQFLRTGDLQNFGAGSLQPDVSRHRKTDGAFLRQIRHGHEFVFSACRRIADRQVPAASLLGMESGMRRKSAANAPHSKCGYTSALYRLAPLQLIFSLNNFSHFAAFNSAN